MTIVAPVERFDRQFADDFAITLRDILSIEKLRTKVAGELDALLSDPRFADPARLLFAGSGDSLFAARSALPALRRWTGLPMEVMTALEFARYEVPLLETGDVLVAVSNSGNSSRTRESLVLAKDRGIPTLGITGSLDGALAKLAERVIHRPVGRCDGLDPDYARVFLNMAEYLASLYTLYALGLELGVRRGRITPQVKTEWYSTIEAAIAYAQPIARATEPVAVGLAQDLADADTIWTIGAGPNRGTAEYCAAKFHEQNPVNGIAQDLEEWAHLQYFLTLSWKSRVVVMVLAPPGNALDRAEELVRGIADAGGRAIVLAHPAHGNFAKAAARFDLDVEVPELVTPVLYHIPIQLLVLHLALLSRATQIPLKRADDYWLIRKGLVLDGAEELE